MKKKCLWHSKTKCGN